MSILYDVPSIGKVDTGYKQKGPTCWYYASKMLLRFHNLLDKTESARVYEQFKTIHELRKIITEGRGYENLRARLQEALSGTEVSSLLAMLEGTTDPRRERLQRVLDKLQSFEEAQLERLEILNTLTDGIFRGLPGTRLQDPPHLERLLRSFGPFYAGGSLAVKRENLQDTGRKTPGGETILGVVALKAESHHAVVVAGIDGETIYYKDPHGTDKLRTVPFGAFGPNVFTRIAAQCPKAYPITEAELEYPCPHCQQRSIAL
jgi:uncharacterized coiled-coil protein SlyX